MSPCPNCGHHPVYEVRPGLLGLLLASFSGAVIGSLLTLALVSAQAFAAPSSGSVSLQPPLSDRTQSGAPHIVLEVGGVAPRATLGPGSGAPLPPGAIGTAILAGRANFAEPSLGSNYLAMREKRGTLVRITGAGGSWTALTTDYGPDKDTHDIADIALVRFMEVCGYTEAEARQRGECDVEIEVMEGRATLPPTDVATP